MLNWHKRIFRILFCVGLLALPLVFGWWMFIFLSLLFVVIANKTYELVVVGSLLDSVYYFGPSIWQSHMLLIVGFFCTALSLLLEREVNWRKLL